MRKSFRIVQLKGLVSGVFDFRQSRVGGVDRLDSEKFGNFFPPKISFPILNLEKNMDDLTFVEYFEKFRNTSRVTSCYST